MLKQRPITEQIAALLHDVSHTAFSHVGDIVFPSKDRVMAYQDEILSEFLVETGISKILGRHNIRITDVLEKPYLDRIDYTIIGGYIAGLLGIDEVQAIFDDLTYNKRKKIWFFQTPGIAKTLGLASLSLTRLNSGAPWNTIVYSYVAKALKRAVALGLITYDDFSYNLTDDEIWEILNDNDDRIIRECMNNVKNHEQHLELILDHHESPSVKIISPKFRGLDPNVKGQDGRYPPLSLLDYSFRNIFLETEYLMKRGFRVSLTSFTGRPPTPFRLPVIYGC